MTAATSHTWLAELARHAASGPVVRAVVIETKGSTPREVGAAMIVAADAAIGTIGGGALEHDVVGKARTMMATAKTTSPWQRETLTYHLGPELNQCCGGAVSVLLECFGAAEAPHLREQARADPGAFLSRPLRSGTAPVLSHDTATPPGLYPHEDQPWYCEPVSTQRQPLALYGAGHVARALVKALADLPFAIHWIDSDATRFPPDNFGTPDIRVGDPVALSADLPAHAIHLVMTHSHALDEAIVTAILRRNRFGYLGLIGSDTKAARFRQRLERAGLAPAAIDRLVCPIGLPGLAGKAPAVIAASVTASLLLRVPSPAAPSQTEPIHHQERLQDQDRRLIVPSPLVGKGERGRVAMDSGDARSVSATPATQIAD